jgi:glycosyltransferase involved in cell wall biosynthesis
MIGMDPKSFESDTTGLISIAVCTYNRSDLLAGVLQSLCAQTIDKWQYEVIIVNNNSTDNTQLVAEDFCRCHGNMRHVFEARQGLSHARNCGWQSARGEYVAYIDDDGKAPEHWLEMARDVIASLSPDVFGGPYFSFFNSPRPKWWKNAYGCHVQGKRAKFLTDGEYLDGGNIFFRRRLLQSLGGFSPALGMSGNKIAYGEETALIRKIRSTMPDQSIYYDPRLYIHHLVGPKKMTLPWIMNQRFADGRYSFRVFQRDQALKDGRLQIWKQFSKVVVKFILNLFIGGWCRDRKQYPWLQNYLYENSFQYLRILGTLYEKYLYARKI